MAWSTATVISEAQWQHEVIDLAQSLGWSYLVARGSERGPGVSVKGWPDLWLWHDRFGFAAIELKVGRNRPTPAQESVLNSLAKAGARTMVAYPEDRGQLLTFLYPAFANALAV